MSESDRKKFLSKQRKAARRDAEVAKEGVHTLVPDSCEESTLAVSPRFHLLSWYWRCFAEPKAEVKTDGEGQETADKPPSGESLARTKTPLDDALKLLKPVLVRGFTICRGISVFTLRMERESFDQIFSPTTSSQDLGQDVEALVIAVDIYLRQSKPLLVLQTVKTLMQLAPEDPAVRRIVAQVIHTFDNPPASMPAPLVAVARQSTSGYRWRTL